MNTYIYIKWQIVGTYPQNYNVSHSRRPSVSPLQPLETRISNDYEWFVSQLHYATDQLLRLCRLCNVKSNAGKVLLRVGALQ
jgi:hypothetical protein